jgi:NADH-quinone oxidoreductase subunit N
MNPELGITLASITASLEFAMPEIIMAVGAMVLLMVGVFSSPKSSGATVTGLAVALLIISGIWLVAFTDNGTGFNGAFAVDPFAKMMKVLALIGSVFAIIMSRTHAGEEAFDRFEYPVLIVLATLGMMLMISATDLIGLYLGLELQSLALYVVAAINRDSDKATEAGLKYFVLGALSSGMLLYGSSLIYGFTGHTTFAGISAALELGDANLGVIFGLVFVIAALAFKVSAVPFHMWTPDVYEGAPTPVTAFFAAAPKVAAMALFVRVVMEAFQPVTDEWRQVIVFIAIASMVLGAFAAIGQRNIKRLMAYSSIGHMGYALVGLAAGTEQGVFGVVLYMSIYLAMTLGTFAVILAMRTSDGMLDEIDDLKGLAQTNAVLATVLTILMFSLAGIPPLAGFWAKWYVFSAAVETGLLPLYILAVIGVLASVVGAFYYIRIIQVMWFSDAEDQGFLPVSGELRLVLGLSTAFVLLYVVFGSWVETYALAAAKTFF